MGNTPSVTLNARMIAAAQATWTQAWHAGPTPPADDPLLVLAEQQHRRNFDLWHEEDKARAPDASDAQIASVKRNIDRLNQQRNDLIEQIDDFLLKQLQQRQIGAAADAPWNSETPGGIIDRLSIVNLKIYHMREQCDRAEASVEHREKARQRLTVLLAQEGDLVIALQRLFEDLFAGRKQMKLYRQFKMYNDPTLNPAVYGAKKKS